MSLIVYTDIKSPYAYLAKNLIYQLEDDYGIEAEWRYFELDIPSYLGAAEVDDQGNVLSSTRTEHQWKKVKYAYMDIRRRANLEGLTILGTQKIWDSTLAGIGMYRAKESGQQVLRAYLDYVFNRFWKRDLDIENIDVVLHCLDQAGAMTEGFEEYAANQGRDHLQSIRQDAWQAGVFGVPFFFVDDEQFFGSEQMPLIRQRLDQLLSK